MKREKRYNDTNQLEGGKYGYKLKKGHARSDMSLFEFAINIFRILQIVHPNNQCERWHTRHPY